MPKLILTVIPVWQNNRTGDIVKGSPQEWLIPAPMDPMVMDAFWNSPSVITSRLVEDSTSYQLQFLCRIREDKGDALGNPNSVE